MADPGNEIQTIEQFHLLFLDQLGARLDKKLYALKGGCNLRFFWKSIRYSEDIDFDVHTIAKHTLQKHVRQILEAPSLRRILNSVQIEISNVSEPKQTSTTQRWKVRLRSPASDLELPTRIEFSRRHFDPGIIFDSVDSEIVASYRLRPILATHYNIETAFTQKLEALIERRETQARDIFDLAFLLQRGATGSANRLDKKRVAKARQLAVAVPFDHFVAQVVAYLLPEYQDFYRNPKEWNQIQERVVQSLEDA